MDNSFTEKIQVAADQVADTLRQLVAEGTVRKIIVRKADGTQILSIPLAAGVAIGGVAVLVAPAISAVAALATLFSNLTVQVERTNRDETEVVIIEVDPEN